jgi:acyl carrier protein
VLLSQLTAYIRDELVGAPESNELTTTTPLLEWGVLDSIKTARLVAYIRDELGVRIPPTSMTGVHFRDIESITDLVVSLTSSAP